MKKLLLIGFSVMLLAVATACSSGDNTDSSEPNDSTQNIEEENQATNEENTDTASTTDANAEDEADQTTNEELNEEKSNHEANIPSEIADFEESDQLVVTIDDLSSLQPKIETDNPNKRIILFGDGDDKRYKSIYIKEKQRLKIIELNEEDGLLFNDTI